MNIHNQRDNKIGGNLKEIAGQEVEVAWTCDAKRLRDDNL